ncbi:hypothetical protein GDO81_027130 [Engystomops pustulosus]|uniref:Uncharacterized protein n=1 Tax=Engystomops pustulosus TaxID=76066 RepID=A0AAV6YG81_ENGPU|nr:hypothetical protein GDO81_027130 [Engystomops pustulosus]
MDDSSMSSLGDNGRSPLVSVSSPISGPLYLYTIRLCSSFLPDLYRWTTPPCPPMVITGGPPGFCLFSYLWSFVPVCDPAL